LLAIIVLGLEHFEHNGESVPGIPALVNRETSSALTVGS
jgi:hypothetical protein